MSSDALIFLLWPKKVKHLDGWHESLAGRKKKKKKAKLIYLKAYGRDFTIPT